MLVNDTTTEIIWRSLSLKHNYIKIDRCDHMKGFKSESSRAKYFVNVQIHFIMLQFKFTYLLIFLTTKWRVIAINSRQNWYHMSTLSFYLFYCAFLCCLSNRGRNSCSSVWKKASCKNSQTATTTCRLDYL